MKKINAVLGFIVLITIISFNGNAQISEGQAAPDFSFTSTDGETFTLSDHKGKVVFMFLFGNNCPSCLTVGGKTESDIYDAFKDNSDFVAVGLDQWDNSSNLASVSSFRSRTGISYPLLIKAGSISTTYGTTYDRLLVVDKDGILRHKGTSGASNDIQNAIMAIQEYLMPASIDKDMASLSLRVFPNPVSEFAELNISVPKSLDIEFLVYNSLGQIKLKENYPLNAGENIIRTDFNMLENGIHFYQLRTAENDVKTGKFLVRKK